MERTGRRPRSHIPNTIHHVMIRGNNKQRIFYTKEQFSYFIDLLKESAEKFDHKILGFCLMSNHAHLVVHIQNSPLSSVMQNINFRYARWSNHRMRRIGHLFQGRYASIEVNNEEYLINLCRYVHFNPIKAGIVRALDQYPWSSHRYYKEGRAPCWLSLSKIQDAIKRKTSLGYSAFMKMPIDQINWKPALYLTGEGKLVIDDEIIKETQGRCSSQEKDKYLSFSTVLDEVCAYFEVDPNEALALTRVRRLAKVRTVASYFMSIYCDASMSSIAKYFRRTQATLSRQVCQIHENFPKDILIKIQDRLEDFLK